MVKPRLDQRQFPFENNALIREFLLLISDPFERGYDRCFKDSLIESVVHGVKDGRIEVVQLLERIPARTLYTLQLPSIARDQ
jgi:hypothetical protein